MERADWLLLFLTEPARRGAQPRGLEPIRIMKGMFLVSMRGEGELADLYRFQPYDYGPFTTEVYRDLDRLDAAALIVQESVPGRSWRAYRPTAAGIERSEGLMPAVAPWEAAVVGDAYRFVEERSFLRLLRDIYRDYPAYASRTVVKGTVPGR